LSAEKCGQRMKGMFESGSGEKGRIVEKVIIAGASGRDFHNLPQYALKFISLKEV
jgi:hypothetical protein